MEDQTQKDKVVDHVDSTALVEEAGVVPSVDDAEAAAEDVHNTHTEQEAEYISSHDNHIEVA